MIASINNILINNAIYKHGLLLCIINSLVIKPQTPGEYGEAMALISVFRSDCDRIRTFCPLHLALFIL